MTAASNKKLITSEEWCARAEDHRATLEPYCTAWRSRRSSGDVHPIHDFLFTYYPFKPGRLLQWHPSFEECLEEGRTASLPSFYKAKPYLRKAGVVFQDTTVLRPKDSERLRFSHNLLQLTESRSPHFSCYGLHEWAMVYRCANPRHAERAPFRLSSDEIASFVESQRLACSHFDATRFFTPAALPLNRLSPSLMTRDQHEQPGCIHANMDLYKWAFKAMPWIGSDLLRKTFLLALELRELDMKASPYDLRAFGYEPVKIETPEGRTEYVRQQTFLSKKASALRVELIAKLAGLLAMAEVRPSSSLSPTS
ncbi:MAG: 3-methyladenine DNA glycosylase [Verrucomicrobiota bacterium JB023]|nr:3-methyladenine DNA glycosylase [Verrucomicrobiota bacterium JB023]